MWFMATGKEKELNVETVSSFFGGGGGMGHHAFPSSKIGKLCEFVGLFFFFFLADTHVLFGGHLHPCFGFLVTSLPGFKARVGSALFTFFGGKCNVHSPRSTSGTTLADLLVAGRAAGPVPTYCCRGEVARIVGL